jgi:small GTP-binding protein
MRRPKSWLVVIPPPPPPPPPKLGMADHQGVPSLNMSPLRESTTAAAAAGATAVKISLSGVSPRDEIEQLPVRIAKKDFDDKDAYLSVKVVMVGPSGVGKSTLISKLLGKDDAPADLQPGTFDFCFLRYRYGTKYILVELVDTCGAERFGALRGHYFRNAHAAMAVCDLTMTAEEVVKSLTDEIGRVQEHIGAEAIMVVAGNKCDLVEYRQVSTGTLSTFCDGYKFSYLETSAKDGSNVEQAFATVVLKLYDRNVAGMQSSRARNGVNKGAYVPGRSAFGSQSKSSSLILPGIALASADPNVSPRPGTTQRQASMVGSPRKKSSPGLCQLI